MASAEIASPRVLIGPPEVRRTAAVPERPTVAAGGATGDLFIDLMTSEFNRPVSIKRQDPPAKGLTENYAPTFLTSGDPCLDFFCQIVPKAKAETVVQLLARAWEADPLTTLKLVCHLRGVRGTGKSDRSGFYTAALWLHRHHPRTLALNARSFAEFGYIKDLLVILALLVRRRRCVNRRRFHERGCLYDVDGERTPQKKKKARSAVGKEEASELRRKKRTDLAERAVRRYREDAKYRFFHDRVVDVFAELLREDLESLGVGEDDGKRRRLSLAAKWCPSLDSSFDRLTLVCESIARAVFPRETHPEYRDLAEEHYAYRVRDRLRREVLVPLRRALELPEVFMSANQWDLIPYGRVASVAMKNYRNLFAKHDEERFVEFLGKVERGEARIAAGALLPHEIVAAAREGETDGVAELQWRRMVADVREKGTLKDCLAVCDVSGSMAGTPMDVCLALGMLVSELSEEPWRGRVITFSENPQLHCVQGRTLREKVASMEGMEWGFNTDFQRVFDNILRVAVEGKLPAEKMVKRLFVFSDMEFDAASAAESWETDYEAIRRKFGEHGYGGAIPEMVFWNLRSSPSIPAGAGQEGVALVSGFSKNMLTLFLEGDVVLTPMQVMELALSGEAFDKLVVFD